MGIPKTPTINNQNWQFQFQDAKGALHTEGSVNTPLQMISKTPLDNQHYVSNGHYNATGQIQESNHESSELHFKDDLS